MGRALSTYHYCAVFDREGQTGYASGIIRHVGDLSLGDAYPELIRRIRLTIDPPPRHGLALASLSVLSDDSQPSPPTGPPRIR